MGVNDLGATHPELSREWHPEKNGEKGPQDVKSGSQQHVWWLGTCGHTWKAKVQHRASCGAGCPFCSGNKVLPGFNDLATTHPALADCWHPSKNQKRPQDVTRGHRGLSWWICAEGHEFSATPNEMTNPSILKRCPTCVADSGWGSSSVEVAIEEALLAHFPDATRGAQVPRALRGRSHWNVDLLIPSIGLVIEYDGPAWHCACCLPFTSDGRDPRKEDLRKTRDLQQNGYRVIRVRTPHLGTITDEDLLFEGTREVPENIAEAVVHHLARLGILTSDQPVSDAA